MINAPHSLLNARGKTMNPITRRLNITRYCIASLIVFAGMQITAFAGTAYVQRNLVSDIAGLADHTDPYLINPWGMASSSTSPLWVSNNHSGTTTVYTGSGEAFPAGNPLVVQIPPPVDEDSTSAPTGQVF